VEIPPGARLLFLAEQVPLVLDASLPQKFNG
jgi:hypothetical protein